MKNVKVNWILALLFSTGLALMYSCDKDNTGKGSFRVAMTDAPADYAALNVEITKVSIYSDQKGWIDINQEAQSVQVLSLANGVEAEIAYADTISVGHYSKVKIVFGGSNTIELNASLGDTSGSIDLGFDGDTEVILEIDAEVKSESQAELLLDFDAAQSVLEIAGTYILRPVIRVMHHTTTGLRGEIQGAGKAVVQVSSGTATYTAYTDANGKFLLRGMPDGIYEFKATPCRPSPTVPPPSPVIISGMIVNQGQVRYIGVIQF